MAAPKYYEGQEFPPKDPSSGLPVLVYRGGKFLPKDTAPAMRIGTPSAPEQKRVGDMQQGFDEANSLASTAADFVQRNARTKTGGVLAIPGATTVAKALGIGGEDLSAMDRDSTSMATQMRTPGMRLTQMEFGKFLGASPSTHSSADNNAENARALYAARTGAAAKSSFYTTWLNTHGSLSGADGAWMDFQTKHFSPDLATYYHDPKDNPANGDPRAVANAALKDKSAQTRAAPQILEPGDYLK